MAPLFSSLTISGDPSASPKRRKGLLGRPSFFSRPSQSIPLEPTPTPKDSNMDMSDFLSSRPAELKVALLPSALSNSSLGPNSAPAGPTPSHSFSGISASTSRNTVLPASHPILTSSGSTFLPPSTSSDLPTLASAIKLPSPKPGIEGISRKPVPTLPAEVPVGLPHSTSGTSIFGSSRLARMASSSMLKDGGMNLGRRISRRLSIDHLRPVKRKPEGKVDIQRWAQGAVSGAEAGEAPAIEKKPGLALPGIRTWRSKFSSSKIPPKRPTGSYTESVRSQRLETWADVGSSTLTGMGALRRMEGSPISVAEVPVSPAQRSAKLLDTLLAPAGEVKLSPQLSTSLSGLITSHSTGFTTSHSNNPTSLSTGFTASQSTSSLAPPNLMSPAVDDKSLLEPMRSPMPDALPERAAIADEVIRGDQFKDAELPHQESGMSFHTASGDLPASASNLIEKTEREQGEGWWSAPRPESRLREESPLRRRSEDRRPLVESPRFRLKSPRRSKRPSVASAVAKFESNARRSKVQFADAEEATPRRHSPRHRRESTTDSFSQLFYTDDVAKLKDRHAVELDALVSALSSAKAQSSELTAFATQAMDALRQEVKQREYAQHKLEMLERKVEILLACKGEFGPELEAVIGKKFASPAKKYRRLIDDELETDEFGRLGGSPFAIKR